jgi:hypothetical protein
MIRYQLINKTGTVLSAEDTHKDLLEYIAACVNSMPELDANLPDSKELMRLVIPGEHYAEKDGKKIVQQPDGRLVLEKTKAYAEKLRMILRQKHMLIPDESICPISFPVSVKMFFYTNTEKRRPFVLSEMTATMLEILVKMGVLQKANTDIVKDTNGSTVVHTSGDAMTVVYIYRIRGD